MKQYRYVVTIDLNDDTGNEEQLNDLKDEISRLLKKRDESGYLLEGGFNHITNIDVDYPSVSKERWEKEKDEFEMIPKDGLL